MLEVLLGASGGVFGILGALGKHALEIWQAKRKAEADLALLQEQNKHELQMADKHAEEIRLEAENAVRIANINRDKEVDVAAYGALSASYDADRATYSDAPKNKWMVLVDFTRGITRPALTLLFSVGLIVFTAWLWIKLPDSVIAQPEFLQSTFYRLIDALIFLATSAVGWWLSARPSSQRNDA